MWVNAKVCLSLWKELKCPSMDKWIKDVVNTHTHTHTYTHTHTHTHTEEYYSAIKKNGILPFTPTWMDLQGIMLSEIKDKYCMISLMWNLKSTTN